MWITLSYFDYFELWEVLEAWIYHVQVSNPDALFLPFQIHATPSNSYHKPPLTPSNSIVSQHSSAAAAAGGGVRAVQSAANLSFGGNGAAAAAAAAGSPSGGGQDNSFMTLAQKLARFVVFSFSLSFSRSSIDISWIEGFWRIGVTWNGRIQNVLKC